MTADQFVLTINPDPTKQGVRIEKAKYEVVRKAILENLRASGPMTFSQLGALVVEQLQPTFDGSVMWYFTTVKLDMEARGELRRVPKSTPQLIELRGGS
ncbi:MAG: hypothetical protein IH589_06220 [Anaerolineales bacterium]|nr:hypothetical protein [Anaerolineales bacterium]